MLGASGVDGHEDVVHRYAAKSWSGCLIVLQFQFTAAPCMRDSPSSRHFTALIPASFPPAHAFQPGNLRSLPRIVTFENDHAVVRPHPKEDLAAYASAFMSMKAQGGCFLFSQWDQHPANARWQALNLWCCVIVAWGNHTDHIQRHSRRESQMRKPRRYLPKARTQR